MQPTVTITARGDERLRTGHPWIYRSDLADVQARGGDVVRVLAPRGRPVGHALYSDTSEIAVRVVDREPGAFDPATWRRRLDAAIAYRASLEIDADAYRLVHAEADLLPSLVVDRYGDYLALQALSQGTDHLQHVFCELLIELLRPRGIIVRNDSRVRRLEGLPQQIGVVYGEVPDVVIVHEGPIAYEVSLAGGQKTGLFLDQRENRAAAGRYARGRALDAFSYQGGFALQMARSAGETIAIEISEEAVRRIERNALRNGLTTVQARVANVFDALRELDRAGERFDTIVLDPPAFAKQRSALPKAAAGYKEINLRALKLLNPGGHLITCTCSYHVDERLFDDIVADAAADAGAQAVKVEKRMQGRDHPVLVGVPETSYLKCVVLRKLDS
jgi:23S rRNA (cytosine1962-C5)-methyltransferase